jgi:hypothetical protein
MGQHENGVWCFWHAGFHRNLEQVTFDKHIIGIAVKRFFLRFLSHIGTTTLKHEHKRFQMDVCH